jgi:FtsH-binding integral membrane protein
VSDWATAPGSLRGHQTATQNAATLFGQTVGYVAITVGFFALGAYLGRDLTYSWGWVAFLGAVACLFGMRFAVRQSATLAAALLFVFGVLMGLAVAPTLVYYASVDAQALWQAGGATALFMIGLGAAGYGSRRDLSGLARACFWDWLYSSCSASWRSSSRSPMPHSSTRSPAWSSSPG